MANTNKSECEHAALETKRQHLHDLVDKLATKSSIDRLFNLASYLYIHVEYDK